MASRQKFHFVPMFHRTNAGPGPVEESTVGARDPGPLTSAMLLWSLTWLLLAACAATGAMVSPDAVGNDPLLPPDVRRYLVAKEQVLLLIPAAVPPIVFLLCSLVAGRGAALARRRRSTIVAVAIAVAGPLFLAYVAAWCTFRFSGRFPDLRALIMFASDSKQLLLHALHMDAIGLTIAVGASFLSWATWTWFCLRALSARASRRLALGVAATGVVVACVVVAARPPEAVRLGRGRVADPQAGVDMLFSDFLAEAESTRTGPLLRVQASLHEKSRVPTRAEGREAVARCRMNPIVSLPDWLRGVEPAKVRRLNVILIEVESLRNDELVSFGGKRTVMPALDALAAGGRIFTRHYTLSSHSNYADIPPLSSHYPLRSAWYHIYPENPPYPRVLIYDLLHGLGYRTAIVSSQNEHWGGMANYLTTPGLDVLLHSDNFDGGTYIANGDTGFSAFAATQKKSGKVDDGATIGRAIEWVDSVPAEQPFFLYLNLQNSHVPYETPASFPAPFPRPDPSLKILFNHIPFKRVAEVKNAYSNSLAYVDSQIARLFEHLRRIDRWEDTIFVLGGDNGEAFLEHGFSAHANALFDEVVHTPVVFHAPGLESGIDGRLAATLDIPPTLLDLLGLPPHPGFQGRSLLGPAPTGDRDVFLVAQTPLAHQYAVVRGRHKLIEDQRKGTGVLYDLLADPGERRDLASSEPATAEVLSQRLDLWVTAQLGYYGDPALYCCFYPPNVPD